MLPDNLVLNPQSLDRLKYQASQNGGKDAIKAAAQQFEAYFLQMMLRNMRQTLSQDGPFDSQETKMFGEMFDQQIAQKISQGKGLGLADMLVQQMQLSLGAQGIQAAPRPYDFPQVLKDLKTGNVLNAATAQPAPGAVSAGALAEGASAKDAITGSPRSFVNELWPHAVDAAAELGVSPHFLLAQAALETGWGKHQVRTADGGNSFNLFNIKAGKNWQGERAVAATTEYVNGTAVKESAQFRAYGSYAEAFADYASLLKNNPRYSGVLNQDAEGFINGLQRGGYATDPAYGDKLRRIIGSVALRQGLAA
jgi:flagellar protein FlgJ